MAEALALATPAWLNVLVRITHPKRDLDSMVSMHLAERYPGVFRGINETPIGYLSQATKRGTTLWGNIVAILGQIDHPNAIAALELMGKEQTPDKHSVHEALERCGIILFDVGGGRFDHHGRKEYQDKCATDLVAEYLGIRDNIEWQTILDYVRLNDLEGHSVARQVAEAGVCSELTHKVRLLELTSLVSTFGIQRKILHNEDLFYTWVCAYLDTAYEQQWEFWNNVAAEFNKHTSTLASDGERVYRIARIESTVREVGSYSRTRPGDNYTLCVNRNPETGHTFITGGISSEKFEAILALLRVAELKKRGIHERFALNMLRNNDFDPCEVWHGATNIFDNFYVAMNGGDKADDAELSVLTLDEVIACVVVGLDSRIMSKQCLCPKKACLGEACSFYPSNLLRCRILRSEEEASS